MKEKPVAYAEAEVGAESVVLTMHDLPDGTYAAGVYQDENDNGKLDSGFMGIPKEPYGFSGKSHGFFGPPHFEDASFVFHEQDRL
jgi:uncharacterized protein (DUF2141 family)